ncbi:MAG: CarD family transcriptional regulator, partial [Clostridia bacterium]|nr:CarD family transcriptional regulator [Clostridia bacterium]
MERLSVGEVLVYDVHGLCRIKEIKSISFLKNEPKKEYYVLEPLESGNSLY